MNDTTDLYRAVMPRELRSIADIGRFANLPGLEVKYFATSFEGASSYARAATVAFGDGPFAVIKTSIASHLIDDSMRCEVDAGIVTIVIPQELLDELSTPQILGD